MIRKSRWLSREDHRDFLLFVWEEEEFSAGFCSLKGPHDGFDEACVNAPPQSVNQGSAKEKREHNGPKCRKRFGLLFVGGVVFLFVLLMHVSAFLLSPKAVDVSAKLSVIGLTQDVFNDEAYLRTLNKVQEFVVHLRFAHKAGGSSLTLFH